MRSASPVRRLSDGRDRWLRRSNNNPTGRPWELVGAVVLLHALLLVAADDVVSDEVEALVRLREAAVVNIAERATQLHHARCGATVRQCGQCSHDSCVAAEEYADAACTFDYGDATGCPAGEGRKLITTEAAIHLPPGATGDEEYARDDVCTFRDLDATFVENKEAAPALLWQYFGSARGVHRSFPYKLWTVDEEEGVEGVGRCKAYDPRFRPWYVAAASGPKNLVIVLDMSGSMVLNQRGDIARGAAKSVLDTLTNNDFVSVVAFSSPTSEVPLQRYPARGLSQGTRENVELVRAFVDGLVPLGGTDFAIAFKAAFDALDEAAEDERMTPCLTTILFMTDGVVDDPDVVSRTMELIAERNGGGGDGEANGNALRSPAFIFTYSLGAGADETNMKRIACENRGIWSKIEENGDLRTQMLEYYTFVAQGMDVPDVVWTEPFADATSGAEIITAAKAAYDHSVDPPRLLGVAGVDLLVDDLAALGDKTTLLRYLSRRSGACPSDFRLSDCQMQVLRAIDHNGTSVCEAPQPQPGDECPVFGATSQQCDDEVSGAAPVFCNDGPQLDIASFARLACCEQDQSEQVAATVAIFVVMVLVMCCVGFICMKWLNKHAVAAQGAAERDALARAKQPRVARLVSESNGSNRSLSEVEVEAPHQPLPSNGSLGDAGLHAPRPAAPVVAELPAPPRRRGFDRNTVVPRGTPAQPQAWGVLSSA